MGDGGNHLGVAWVKWVVGEGAMGGKRPGHEGLAHRTKGQPLPVWVGERRRTSQGAVETDR